MIIASIPILFILVLMIGFRWGAARAGAGGYLAALFLAIFFFGAGVDVLAFAHVKAFILSMDVLFIIWAAYLLYPRLKLRKHFRPLSSPPAYRADF